MKKFAYIKVTIFLTAVVLTVCFGIGKINIHNIKYNSEVKSLSEYFWKDSDKKMNYIVKEYNQTAEIDNYTITLDSAVFNDKTETIYARFRVSEKNSRVKSYIYLDDNMWKAFGENNRFSLWVNADVGREGKFYT